MRWQPGDLNPRNVVPRFRQRYSQNSPDSASRRRRWNCGTVKNQLPFWNGRIVSIIGQLSINGSVQFWGIPDFIRNHGLSFIKDLQAPTITTGWGHSNTSNQKCGVSPEELTEMSLLPGVLLTLPLGFTGLLVRRPLALLHAMSVMTFVVWGITTLWVYNPQVATLSSIRGWIVAGMIGRFRLINNVCCKSPLLVSATFILFPSLMWVTVFRSLAGSSFASFVFPESDS